MRLANHAAASMLFACALAGCSGSRHLEKPSSAAGYSKLEIRDIAALGTADVNAEVTAEIGPLTSYDDCGLIVFPIGAASNDVALKISAQSSAEDLAAAAQRMQAAFAEAGALTLSISISRERYAEVRDLHPGDRVRVRGYLSKWMADGCSWFQEGPARVLWIDSIERLPPSP